jgi:hypothetical protein
MSLLLLFLTLVSFAQKPTENFQYQMDGSYKANLPGLSESQQVNYSLLWNEKNGNIAGLYRDNFFSSNSPMTGISGAEGRVFNATFPRVIQNVFKISLTSVSTSLESGTIPLMIFLKDRVDMTIDQMTTSATLITRSDYRPETETCDSGFGELKGYCGLYKGTLTELNDSNNLCNLPDYGFRMELSKEGMIQFYFYYSEITIGIPSHSLGAFDSIPLSKTINMSERHCGSLVGTIFPNSNCQNLRLYGTFSRPNDKKKFNGTYSLQDIETNESCSYGLILESED